MPTPITHFSLLAEAVEAYREAVADGHPPPGTPGVRGALSVAAEMLELPLSNSNSSLRHRLDVASALGLEVPGWPMLDRERQEAIKRRYKLSSPEYVAWAVGRTPVRKGRAKVLAEPSPVPSPVTSDTLLGLLKRGSATAAQLAEATKGDVQQIVQELNGLSRRGMRLFVEGDRWSLASAPPTGVQSGDFAEIVTDSSGRVTLGAIGDTHLASKYERLDCLETFYDQAVEVGARTILHAGNYVEGQSHFNTYDVKVHGLDPQLRYLADHYPRREGVETWAITGADHEGWWSKREAVDVGRYAANAMREAGRDDWRDLGFMEAYVRLVHGGSGKSCMLHIMHPGGGSAYAVSYAPQKIVEAYDGGDKPAVLLIGHYHKMSYNLARNVHAIQVGCFQDQTPFMRQKKLSAHLGGVLLGLRLDERTGAVAGCNVDFRNFFVRDFYSGRWSMHGDAQPAPREARGSKL